MRNNVTGSCVRVTLEIWEDSVALSEVVQAQRDGGGATGVAFAPNSDSADYCELFTNADVWSQLRDRLSAFKIYSENVRSDCGTEEARIAGRNTHSRLCEVNVYGRLREWGLPLHLEAPAVKEWEPDDQKGRQALEVTRVAMQRIHAVGGRVSVVCMDEPLTSQINSEGDPEPHPRKWTANRGGEVAGYVAKYVRGLREDGVQVALLEAYPNHRALFINEFLKDIVRKDRQNAPLAFFELDVDLWGIQKKSRKEVRQDLDLLRRTCADEGLPFRVIVMSTHAKTADDYADQARDLLTEYTKLLGPVDGITVQSWNDHEHERTRRLPSNLPMTNARSHLRLLADVLDRKLLK